MMTRISMSIPRVKRKNPISESHEGLDLSEEFGNFSAEFENFYLGEENEERD